MFFKKLILGSFISLLISILSCIFYFRGAISLTFNIIKDLKLSNKTIETLAQVKDYYGLDTMDVKNLNYKNCDNTLIDIFSSNIKDSPSSVIIYLHGGAWVYGDNLIPIGMKPIINSFNNKGYTIISLSYELLSNDIDLSKPISDVKDLIRWVHKNKDIYNFNENDIGILGISSGAHLGMMAAYSDNNYFVDDIELSKYPSDINYIIDAFGPTELSTLDFNFLNSDLINNKEVALNDLDSIQLINSIYSPLFYISENTPKTLIIHSIEDDIVPYKNSLDLLTKLQSNNIESNLITLNNGTHDFEGFKNNELYLMVFEVLKFLVNNSNL